MYNAETLLDVHARAHESFRRLIVLCGTLTHEELHGSLDGFGFPSVFRQLRHTIGAEVYWQTVLTRGYTEEATLPPLESAADVEAFRGGTASATRTYLAAATASELNTRREMVTDPGKTKVLRPADVVMRIVTHMFSHQGQILAMCRTLGKPNRVHDVDYPIS